MRAIFLLASHGIVLAIGFALGVYMLPILTAPPPPSAAELSSAMDGAQFKARFTRDLPGSDFLHWGEGEVSVGARSIALQGKVSPGPDFKLYLSKGFVDDEASFERLKSTMVRIGDVKTFENFVVPVPDGVDVSAFDTVVVWCEAFSEFITAAKYR